MLHLRNTVLRALPISASPSLSIATRNTRSFVTILSASPATSCTTRLSRPQRANVILQSLRRTYSTEDDKSALESTKESVSEVAGSSSSIVEDATKAAERGASSMTEEVKSGVESAREAVGDALGSVASTISPDRASSRQTSPIREEATRVSAPEGSPSGNLYVGNLFFEVEEQALSKEFERFGKVKSAKIIRDARGLSKGFGYIEMENASAASDARDRLDGQNLEGRRLLVQHAIQRVPRRRPTTASDAYLNPPNKTLFIGNMSYEMSDKDLNDMFKEIKNVTDVRVAIDRRTGQPRGFAHADFTDVQSAEAAAEFLKQREYNGRTLRIDFSQHSK